MNPSKRILLVGLTVSTLSVAAPKPQVGLVEPHGLNVIAVSSESNAREIRDRLQAGASFEALAVQLSEGPAASEGGYVGVLPARDLDSELQSVLAGLKAGEVSPPTRSGRQFMLLRWSTPAEEVWRADQASGLDAMRGRRYSEAIRRLRSAVEHAEAFGAEDYRLSLSLRALGRALYLDGQSEEAARLLDRSLRISQRELGAMHPSMTDDFGVLGAAYFLQGKHAEAEPWLRRNLELVEKRSPPEDSRVVVALSNLAFALKSQKKSAEAEPLLERALPFFEKNSGPADAGYLKTLEALADVRADLGKNAGAETLYWRLVALRWGGASSGDPAKIMRVLDTFAAVMRRAYFSDNQLTAALGSFREAAKRTPLGEDLYLAMADELAQARLDEEAVALLSHAVETLPESRRLRYNLASLLYLGGGRSQRALDVFRETEPLLSRGTPADKVERSVVYTNIGRMNSELVRFDEAIAAFKAALEWNPLNSEARVSLGSIYLGLDRAEDAIREFSAEITAHPTNADAHYGLAEAEFRRGRFDDAAASAAKAFELDPTRGRSKYVRGNALMRAGHEEEGQKELEDFRSFEARAQEERNRQFDVRTTVSAAMTEVTEGRTEKAIDLLKQAIERNPGAAELSLVLALAESKSDRHPAAVEILRKMIETGSGAAYVVHRTLSLEYAQVNDTVSSQRQRTMYLQKLVGALESRSGNMNRL